MQSLTEVVIISTRRSLGCYDHCEPPEKGMHLQPGHCHECMSCAPPVCQADAREDLLLWHVSFCEIWRLCTEHRRKRQDNVFLACCSLQLDPLFTLLLPNFPCGDGLVDHMDPYGDPPGFAPRLSGQDITFSWSCASKDCRSYQQSESMMRRLQVQPR